jgi:hypothetical protein
MSEHDNGWDFAKRLSEALLKVRPLGGSELFVKRNNQYYADPDYCGRMIEELRTSLDLEIRARIRLERQLTALSSSHRAENNEQEGQ